MKQIKFVKSIFEVAENFDAFIVDLWGVIHDGVNLYPGVIDTLKKFKSQKKEIIFLSNAPRRSSRVIEVLDKMGISKDYYKTALSSGEVTYQTLVKEKIGDKYYYIGPERDAGLLDGSNYARTDNCAEADFAIVTGFEEDNSTLQEKIPDLEKCLQNHLTLICANPDMEVVRIDGSRALCSGVIAKAYQEMGGKVIYFGKPYPAVYEKSFELLSVKDKSRIAAIGDNLETDIKGGNDAGIATILIAGGVLAEKVIIKNEIDQEKITSLCRESKNIPDFAALKFG